VDGTSQLRFDSYQALVTRNTTQKVKLTRKSPVLRLSGSLTTICDPIEINFEYNTDEYEPEARTILPRLRTCHSAEDVLTVVHEEFQRWFDPEIAGPREKYSTIANDVWTLWQKSSVADAT
jgi:hypothetical protein